MALASGLAAGSAANEDIVRAVAKAGRRKERSFTACGQPLFQAGLRFSRNERMPSRASSPARASASTAAVSAASFSEIGALPLEWNWLVGEYQHNPDAKIVHYTLGGPYFDEYRSCDYAEEWFEENRRMNYAVKPARG